MYELFAKEETTNLWDASFIESIIKAYEFVSKNKQEGIFANGF